MARKPTNVYLYLRHNTSFYGTFDQGGNVWEWNDAVGNDVFLRVTRGIRGGAWLSIESHLRSLNRSNSPALDDRIVVGFRLATVPAPTLPTNVMLTLEKTTDLSSGWQTAPVTSNMITPAGELDLGAMTSTHEFYRLKIRTTVE
jgi:hypothetical protein